MRNFNFNTDQEAMAALHEHLKAAIANHGVTFVLVPLADAIGELLTIGNNLTEAEKQQGVKSLTNEFGVILTDTLGLTNHIMSGTK